MGPLYVCVLIPGDGLVFYVDVVPCVEVFGYGLRKGRGGLWGEGGL